MDSEQICGLDAGCSPRRRRCCLATRLVFEDPNLLLAILKRVVEREHPPQEASPAYWASRVSAVCTGWRARVDAHFPHVWAHLAAHIGKLRPPEPGICGQPDHDGSAGLSRLRAWWPAQRRRQVRALALTMRDGMHARTEVLGFLSACPSLESVSLRWDGVERGNLFASLKPRCQLLRRLDLSRCAFTDAAVMRLCGFPLDATASWLLRLLVAPYKDGWRDPRRSLAHVLPCLEHLDICGARGVSDHGVFALLLRCTHSLKELRMGGCQRLTDTALVPLGWMLRLETLSLRDDSPRGGLMVREQSAFTSEGLGVLFEEENGLTTTLVDLDLGFCQGVANETMAIIGAGLRALKRLNVEGCTRVTSAGVGALLHTNHALQALELHGPSLAEHSSLLHEFPASHAALTTLAVRRGSALTSAALTGLLASGLGLTHLELIDFGQHLDSSALEAVGRRCPMLRTLVLKSGVHHALGADPLHPWLGLRALAKGCSELRKVHLIGACKLAAHRPWYRRAASCAHSASPDTKRASYDDYALKMSMPADTSPLEDESLGGVEDAVYALLDKCTSLENVLVDSLPVSSRVLTLAASALPQLRKLYFHSVFASSKNISDILAGALSDHKWPLLQSLTIHKEAGVNIVGDELTPEHDKVKGPTSTVCAYAPGVQVCRLDFDIFSTADIHTGTAGDARVLQEWVSQA